MLEIWRWWYEHPKLLCSNSVNDFMKEALLPNDISWHLSHDNVSALDDIVSDAAKVLTYRLDRNDLPSSVWRSFQEWSQTTGPVKWTQCVTHGDLHGGNIFLDPKSSEVWLIDFARTGRRLSVFDLATLEVYTKYQFLPSLLRKQKLLSDQWSFVLSFIRIERFWACQTSYENLGIPAVESKGNDGALEALKGAVRVVINIRMHLQKTLSRKVHLLNTWSQWSFFHSDI